MSAEPHRLQEAPLDEAELRAMAAKNTPAMVLGEAGAVLAAAGLIVWAVQWALQALHIA